MITRPHHHSTKALITLLTKQGIRVWHLPLITHQAQGDAINIPDYVTVIFTSIAAVEFFFAQKSTCHARQCFAIGKATWAALKTHGIQAQVPPTPTSEGLLTILPHSSPQYWIIKGAGGRTLLSRILTARGATVVHQITYHRRALNYSVLALQEQWKYYTPTSAWVTSCEILQHYHDHFRDGGINTIYHLPLAVASERIATSAANLGFRRIYNLQSANNQVVLPFIKRLQNSHNSFH